MMWIAKAFLSNTTSFSPQRGRHLLAASFFQRKPTLYLFSWPLDHLISFFFLVDLMFVSPLYFPPSFSFPLFFIFFFFFPSSFDCLELGFNFLLYHV